MSIIADALSKAKKERMDLKHAGEKASTEKIAVPEKKDRSGTPQSYSSSLFFRSGSLGTAKTREAVKKIRVRNMTLLLLIFFILALVNFFLDPSAEVKRVPGVRETERRGPVETAKETVAPAGDEIEAEAYTDLKTEIVLIEKKEGIIDRVSEVLKGESARDRFLATFELSGIIYDNEDPWAIINDKVVRAGDEISGAKVVSIAPRKVILFFKNEKFDLVLR